MLSLLLLLLLLIGIEKFTSFFFWLNRNFETSHSLNYAFCYIPYCYVAVGVKFETRINLMKSLFEFVLTVSVLVLSMYFSFFLSLKFRRLDYISVWQFNEHAKHTFFCQFFLMETDSGLIYHSILLLSLLVSISSFLVLCSCW